MLDSINLPLVSVIIPTYNRGYILHRTIEAVINQTYTNREIIIVDDGSTDDTKKVVAAFGNKLQYIQKKHSGQGDTRNIGLQYAKGEIIAPLDSDDTWHEEFLEKSVGYMIDNNLDMFFSNWAHYISPQKKIIALAHFSNTIKAQTKDCYIFDYKDFRGRLLEGALAPSSSLIIKKTSMNFGWNPRVHIGDDYFLQLEMVFKNPDCRVGFTSQVLWQKNINNSNICDGRKGTMFRKLIINDLLLISHTFKSVMTEREREIIFVKIVINKILIIYYSILEWKIGQEINEIFIDIFSKPKLLFIAVKTGIYKLIVKNIQRI